MQTDRVILRPGPADEVAIVNQMYRWFIDDALIETEIAGRINGMNEVICLNREWTRATVHEVLTKEYVGHIFYYIFNYIAAQHAAQPVGSLMDVYTHAKTPRVSLGPLGHPHAP